MNRGMQMSEQISLSNKFRQKQGLPPLYIEGEGGGGR